MPRTGKENEADSEPAATTSNNNQTTNNKPTGTTGSGKAGTKKKSSRTSGQGGALAVRRSSAKKKETYNLYIYRVLKQVHPEIGVSKRAMEVLNSFVTDVFERICEEGSKLCHYNKKQTLGAREVATATQLVLPGELAKHAKSEGMKSVNKYQASVGPHIKS